MFRYELTITITPVSSALKPTTQTFTYKKEDDSLLSGMVMSLRPIRYTNYHTTLETEDRCIVCFQSDEGTYVCEGRRFKEA